jgi:hypothetical protein
VFRYSLIRTQSLNKSKKVEITVLDGVAVIAKQINDLEPEVGFTTRN